MYKRNVWTVFVVSIILFLALAGGALAARETVPTGVAHLPAGQGQTPEPPQPGGDLYPAIEALASYFGVPVEEIKALHDSGVGLGVIAEAYVLSSLLELTPQEIIDLKTGGNVGWGQILKDAGLDSGKVKLRLGNIFAQRKGQDAAQDDLMGTQAGEDPARTQERVQERAQEPAGEQNQDQSRDGSGGGSNGGGDGGNGGGSNGGDGGASGGDGGGDNGGGKGK